MTEMQAADGHAVIQPHHCIGVLPELRLMVQDLADTWQPATQNRVLTNRIILNDQMSRKQPWLAR